MAGPKTLTTYLLGGAAGLSAGAIAWSALAVNHKMPLPAAIAARRRVFDSSTAGPISFYCDEGRGGRPMLLLHSVNAAASAREVQPLFDNFRGETPVYAPDLPGFGFSARMDRVYSPDFYAAALVEFVQQQIAPPRGGVDVVALSLSCEFAAIAAAHRRDLFRSFVFISPTGFDATNSRHASGAAYQTVAFPLWSQPFFDLLVSRPAIRHYLRKSFAGAVDSDLAEYAFLTAHQPGARFAPFYFLSGRLFTPGIRDVYGCVEAPVLVVANRDGYVSFPALPEFAEGHPNWLYTRIVGARSLPHFDNPGETVAVLGSFWRRLPEPVLV